MLIDSHAHLQFKDLSGNLAEVLKRAKASGVERIITVGVDGRDSELAVDLAAKHPFIYATVGLHPHDAKNGLAELPLVRQLSFAPKVVAIGECGLDYYRPPVDGSPMAQQVGLLQAQVELALERDLPVVFHVRDAFEDFFRVMREYPSVRGVVHSFSGSERDLEQILERGWYVALNGIATFTKDADQLAAFKAIPLSRLLLETDCPFLAPMGWRGQTNEPARVADIADFVARLRGEERTRLAEATTLNCQKLFGIE
jgi:TatD DNase family protein